MDILHCCEIMDNINSRAGGRFSRSGQSTLREVTLWFASWLGPGPAFASMLLSGNGELTRPSGCYGSTRVLAVDAKMRWRVAIRASR